MKIGAIVVHENNKTNISGQVDQNSVQKIQYCPLKFDEAPLNKYRKTENKFKQPNFLVFCFYHISRLIQTSEHKDLYQNKQSKHELIT